MSDPSIEFHTNDDVYHAALFNSIHEGVFFVGPSGVITEWNRSAEWLTGISAEGIVQQKWDPSLLSMKDDKERVVDLENCPVHRGMKTGLKSRENVMVLGRDSVNLKIDLQVVPIVERDGTNLGVLALLRDETSEVHLEERVHELRKKATCDPLTGLANRAEFDRQQDESISHHQDHHTTCSLIICDIDRFKSINDEYGHQAGDEALIRFAGILQRNCRTGDLVARYGGEEFVMVCEDCTSTSATQIANDIRKELAATPMQELDGKNITASFGVTELQPGGHARYDVATSRSWPAECQGHGAQQSRPTWLRHGIGIVGAPQRLVALVTQQSSQGPYQVQLVYQRAAAHGGRETTWVRCRSRCRNRDHQ